jgi:hypothetical protein
MKHRYVVTYLLAVALGFSQTQPPTTQDAGKPGSIGGTVRDAGTGAPMAEAEVFVNGMSRRGGPVQTDAQGRYAVRDLKPGDYDVSAYAPANGGSIRRPHASRLVTLPAGQELTSIDFRLESFGKIGGKVIDDNGEPVAGVSVFLVAREYSLGALRYVFTAAANTDDRGVYSLASVPPGRAYLLYAWKITRQLKPVSDAPAEVRLRKRAAEPTFYPSSDSIEGAAPVTLRPGEAREGIDIRMLRSPSYCIDGEAPSIGVGNMLFMIGPARPTSGMSGDGGLFIGLPSGKVGADHKLRICDLSPGDYQLTLTDLSNGPGGAPPYFGSAEFTIKDQDVHRIAVDPRIPVKVPGEVVWDGTASAEPMQSKLSFLLQPLTRSWLGEETNAQSSIPGEFLFPGLLVDGYRVTIPGMPRDLYVRDVTYGGATILHRPLQPGSGVGEAHLRVVLGRDGGFLKARPERSRQASTTHSSACAPSTSRPKT